jgi:WD40 repeat protein
VRLWNLNTNLQVGPPLRHDCDVNGVAFSPDGTCLVTGAADNNAYMWDIRAMLKDAGLEHLLLVPDVSVKNHSL